jgi:aryl-alcohol dehydrogenase-like predicted oxidoreductase
MHPIVAGVSTQDMEHGPFRPDTIAADVDFFSVHPYTIYTPELFPDPMLSERSTYGAAFETTLSGGAGPPGMVQGLGASSGQYPFEVRYDYSYDGTLRSLEHSMQRLGTNAIDIVLIHDVNRRWQGDLVEQRYAEAMSGAYRALHDLRAQGAIKAFGVGVNDWSILMRFAADGDFDCFMLAGRYTLLDHTALDTFMPECRRRNISVLMAAPFNSGILATGANRQSTTRTPAATSTKVARPRQ